MPVKDTEEESAELKMALKHDPMTDALAAEAKAFPLEAGEAIDNVERGYDTCATDSWVAWALKQEEDDAR